MNRNRKKERRWNWISNNLCAKYLNATTSLDIFMFSLHQLLMMNICVIYNLKKTFDLLFNSRLAQILFITHPSVLGKTISLWSSKSFQNTRTIPISVLGKTISVWFFKIDGRDIFIWNKLLMFQELFNNLTNQRSC